MNIGALIFMLTTEITITVLTVYFFVRVLRSPKHPTNSEIDE